MLFDLRKISGGWYFFTKKNQFFLKNWFFEPKNPFFWLKIVFYGKKKSILL